MRTLWLKLYRYSCGAGLILKAKKGDDSIIGEDAKGSSDLHKLSGFLFFGGGGVSYRESKSIQIRLEWSY